MNNKIISFTLAIFFLIILLIYSENIMSFGKRILFKQKGYIVCSDIKCMNEAMQDCTKCYYNNVGGNNWVEIVSEGVIDGKCTYFINRSDKTKTKCQFEMDIFSKELVDEIFGVHHGLREVVDSGCQEIIKK